MCGCNGAQMSCTADKIAHLLLGFLVSLTAFGVLQLVSDTGLVDVGYVSAKNLVLSADFINLILEFAVALL